MNQLTNEHIKSYIESKRLAWAPASLRSEASRLHARLADLNLGPQALYEQTSTTLKPYAVKTLFVRAGELYAHAHPESVNPFKQFVKTNARLFKNAYTKERLNVSFEEAKARIERITDDGARTAARAMLQSGLRAHELLKYDGSGSIIGKGDKLRTVYLQSFSGLPEGLTYSAVHSALKAVGLKPHTLRKLAATQLVRAGFQAQDLMAVMGWSSMQTATSYIQPESDEQLKRRVMEVLG